MRLATISTTKRKKTEDDSSSTRNLADSGLPLPVDCYDGAPAGVHTIISSSTHDYEDYDITAHQDINRIRVLKNTVVEVNSI